MSIANGTNLPMNFAEELAKQAESIQKRIASPSGDRIRMDGRGYTLPNGQSGPELEVVIIDFVSSNIFYEGNFDKNNPSPPACFAVGPEPTLLRPTDLSPDKQSETCAACPNNQFGSNGKGKACKNTRLLAITPLSEGDDPDDRPIWIMSVPPTSIKAFDAYVASLAIRNRTLPIGVATKLFMDGSVSFAAPRFDAVRPLGDDELASVFPMREEAMARLLATPDFSGYEAAKSGGGKASSVSRRGR